MPGSFSILFWNVNEKDLSSAVSRIVAKHPMDLIVLAELAGSVERARSALAKEIGQPVFYVNQPGLPARTHLFSNHGSSLVTPLSTDTEGRLCMFRISHPLFPEFVLGTVHLLSKLWASEETLAEESRRVMSEVRKTCEAAGTNTVLLCGDFNQNPFDKGNAWRTICSWCDASNRGRRRRSDHPERAVRVSVQSDVELDGRLS